MLGAPKGCIPLGKVEGFIAAREVGSVIRVRDKFSGTVAAYSQNPPSWIQMLNSGLHGATQEIFAGNGILVSVGPERFYFEMSVQQFAARMVEALAELGIT
jgi:hypothetical protein